LSRSGLMAAARTGVLRPVMGVRLRVMAGGDQRLALAAVVPLPAATAEEELRMAAVVVHMEVAVGRMAEVDRTVDMGGRSSLDFFPA